MPLLIFRPKSTNKNKLELSWDNLLSEAMKYQTD